VESVRQIIYYKGYFLDFFDGQPEKVKEKINQVLFLITVAERIPRKFFQHMAGTDGLYEVKVEFGSNIYRIFCCFDEGKIVVLFNGFQKKTQKTPSNEIDKALKIKNEYLKEKKDGKGK
jgi:phage-related protein